MTDFEAHHRVPQNPHNPHAWLIGEPAIGDAVILMGSQIGHNSVVGAGAVVCEGTIAPSFSSLVGVPARIIPDGTRHYAALGTEA